MGKVVCFGEIMMRLNPEGYKRFVQASAFEASYAGGEANVAVSLANYGVDSRAMSPKLPDARDRPVRGERTAPLRRGHGGASCAAARGWASISAKRARPQRGSKVHLRPRAVRPSAPGQARTISTGISILDGADWFHFTGITPALGGESARNLPGRAEGGARAKGITVSHAISTTAASSGRASSARRGRWRSSCPMWTCASPTRRTRADVFGIRGRKHGRQRRGKLDRERLHRPWRAS